MKRLMGMTLLAGLTGCSSLYMPNEIMSGTFVNQKDIFLKGDVIDLSKITVQELDQYDSDQGKRNQFVAMAVALSDKACLKHKANIVGNSAGINVSMGSTAMILSGAAAITTPAVAAAQLAAGAAVTSGVQSLANKEVYADSLGSTIVRAIDVARDKRRATLIAGMNDVNYQFPVAIMDIVAYHDSCSLVAGLSEVTKAFNGRQPSSNEVQAKILQLKKLHDDVKSFNLNAAQAAEVDAVYSEEIKSAIKKLGMATTD